MKGNEMLKKVDTLLGTEKELIILKGKLTVPQKAATKADGEIYYTFRLKTLKRSSNDEYGQSFNTYQIVVPCDVAKNISESELSALKNNEVLCICQANANAKVLPNGAVVNNISLFVIDMMLSRSIDNVTILQKAINL